MTILDILRAIVCSVIGHKLVEQPDGTRVCVRCRRFIHIVS